MKIKYFTAIVSLFMFVLYPVIASAHSDRTDSSGCHINNKTGEYHCHTSKTPEVTTAKIAAKTEAKHQSKIYADMDCRDFATWRQAQDTFEQYGEVNNDIFDLDRDHDGIACEALR